MQTGRRNRLGLVGTAVGALFVLALAVQPRLCSAPTAEDDRRGKDFLVVPTSGPLAGKTIYGNSHALLIGVNEYAKLPRDSWLEYAVDDVTSLREVLMRSYAFPSGNITVLTNRQATAEGIRKALASLSDRRRVQPDDRVLIYFSGHGQTVKLPTGGEMGYLIPYDADVDIEDVENPGPFLASCLPMKAVWDYLESSQAKHVLLLVDACYSGLLARPRTPESVSPEVLTALAGRRAVQVITAGRRGERSFEMTKYGHGAFTYKLLDELRARADDRGSVFTASELYVAVKRGVANASAGKQTPQMGDYDTEGDFIFVPTAPASVAALESPPSGDATAPLAADPPSQAQAGQVWVCPIDGAPMVYVPAGEFTMGGPQSEFDNSPGRRLFLPAFYIDRHEVTNERYARFLNATSERMREQYGDLKDPLGYKYVNLSDCMLECVGGRWRPKPGLDRYAVVGVTFYGALAYAAWAGKVIPTEAGWEKAARGMDGRRYPWGNDWDPRRCDAWAFTGGRPSSPVGSYPGDASPYGCMDMAGNVFEWTCSCDDGTTYQPGPGDRGGPYLYTKPGVARLADRGGDGVRATSLWGHKTEWASGTDPGRGFRCVKAPEPATR
ncbi:MAG: SUMF1/EgtB/PvdO family nonheme iron enzyme [Armatimonadetes bacterium]|nr:SUMF1/EgtB/PvdO family nonheme iron enzyme [Armatimonadota bacterium]